MRAPRACRGTGNYTALGILVPRLDIPMSTQELEWEAVNLPPKGGWRLLRESLYLPPPRTTDASGSFTPKEGLLTEH